MLKKKEKPLLDSDDSGIVSPHFANKKSKKDPFATFVDDVPIVAAQSKHPAERAPARKAQEEQQRKGANLANKASATPTKPPPTPIARPGVRNISRPATQNVPRSSAATITLPGAKKPGHGRGLLVGKKESVQKPSQNIGLSIFHRGERQAQGENCHLKVKQVHGETVFTPWVGDTEHWDLQFSVDDIGSLCQYHEMRVNIKLRKQYHVPANGQYIDFTIADQGSFDRFCEIITSILEVERVKPTNSSSVTQKKKKR